MHRDQPYEEADTPHANRLAGESSPYLLQHAHQPVDWYPWGADAFERARREDKPVFLSVGYSACHWCHVMAHESFDHEEVARLLNAHFVSIKVDREERPEIDELYIRATQLFGQRGGWPNSVWLTPDGRPWFAGTYFPREDRPGMTGFLSLLRALAEAWTTRRPEVEQQADRLTEILRKSAVPEAPAAPAPEAPALVQEALDALRAAFDAAHGGFGGAPKFPPHGELELLLDLLEMPGREDLLPLVQRTLEAMAAGGLHDHVGGGFHRYATDAQWRVPHFEKMLYDNARLGRLYLRAWQRTGEAWYAQVARGVYDWMLREMAAPEGGLYSALDADSEGGEGLFYLWSLDALHDALGPEDGPWAARVFGATAEGNFRDEATGRRNGLNILFLPAPPAACAARNGVEPEAFQQRLAEVSARLLARRDERPRPARDEKILTAWNGLAIGSLAAAAAAFDEPRYREAAVRAAEFMQTRLVGPDGRLRRAFTHGEARLPAYLDDYACLADGLLDLHEAVGDDRWLHIAQELIDVLFRHYRDDEQGGFFFTADDHEKLLCRFKEPYDQATPSGNAVAARVMVRLYRRTQAELYRVTAEESFRTFAEALRLAPRAAPTFLRALAAWDAPAIPSGILSNRIINRE